MLHAGQDLPTGSAPPATSATGVTLCLGENFASRAAGPKAALPLRVGVVPYRVKTGLVPPLVVWSPCLQGKSGFAGSR